MMNVNYLIDPMMSSLTESSSHERTVRNTTKYLPKIEDKRKNFLGGFKKVQFMNPVIFQPKGVKLNLTHNRPPNFTNFV